MNYKKILQLPRKLIICLFLISLASCSLSRETKIISNYCYLYSTFPDDLEQDVISYWVDKEKIINNKNSNGGVKTSEEKLFEIFVDYAGTNDKIYYEKKCDEINNN